MAETEEKPEGEEEETDILQMKSGPPSLRKDVTNHLTLQSLRPSLNNWGSTLSALSSSISINN